MVIPVIDVAGMQAENRKSIKTQIVDAIDQVGFFQILNHGIPVELMERVKQVVTENFKSQREPKFKESLAFQELHKAIEQEEKDQQQQSAPETKKKMDEQEEKDQQQQSAPETKKKMDDVDWEDIFTLQYDDPNYQWPSQPSNFRETLQEFGAAVKALAEKLLELLDEALGLEKGYLKRALGGDSAFFGTKVSHYAACPRSDLIWGLRAHTDAGGIILLLQDDQVSGLECKTRSGEWVEVQPVQNAIVINLGDQLEAISNGRLRSAWHRICANTNGTRMSVASYYNPNLQTLVQPAPGLMLPAYPSYVFGEYMKVYAQEKFMAKEPRFQAAAATVVGNP